MSPWLKWLGTQRRGFIGLLTVDFIKAHLYAFHLIEPATPHIARIQLSSGVETPNNGARIVVYLRNLTNEA